jgi:hypothetical protein
MIILIIIVTLFLILIIYSCCVHANIQNQIIHDYTLPTIEDINKTHKIIWSYWDTPECPIIVKLARHTWYKNNPNYLICILTNDTLKNYLAINTFPKKYNQCSIQRKTDVIRLALLEKYGGFWLDSTILLNESLDNIWDFNYDVGGYEAEFFTTDEKHPVLESWFLCAPKNNSLITAWKNEFYKAVDSDDYNLYIKNMEKTVNLQNIDMKVYLMIHCCFLKVINSEKKYKWKMLPAGKNNGPFSYLDKCNWNILSAVHYLLSSSDPVPPVIKLRMPERLLINYYIYYSYNNSIINRLI